MTTATALIPREVSGSWTLLTSMTHGADEILGTTRLFRTEGMIFEGRVVQVPVVAGNSIRGLWRRACAAAFMDEYISAGGEPLSLSAFYYLTSGGALKKGGTGAAGFDLGKERSLRQLIPHVGLFGGAGMGNIQPGKLRILPATVVCRETVDLLALRWPEVRDLDTAPLSFRDLLQVRGYSRQDDAKNEHLHQWLSPAARSEARGALQRIQDEDEAAVAGASQQMRYEQVELLRGAQLHHGFSFRYEPSVEEAASFLAGMMRWAEWAHAAGRSGVGHGMLLPRYHGATPEVRLIGDGSDPMAVERPTVDEVLRGHVRMNLEEIQATLGAL